MICDDFTKKRIRFKGFIKSTMKYMRIKINSNTNNYNSHDDII